MICSGSSNQVQLRESTLVRANLGGRRAKMYKLFNSSGRKNVQIVKQQWAQSYTNCSIVVAKMYKLFNSGQKNVKKFNSGGRRPSVG